MKLWLGAVFVVLACMIVFNCDAPPGCGDSNEDPNYALAALETADSCETCVRQIKANYIQVMERRVDQNLESALMWYRDCEENSIPSIPGSSSSSSSSGSSSSSSGGPVPDGGSADTHSETNNQVPGVDEADFIKNDGGHIYILAGNQFKIVDAWPPQSAAVLSSTAIEGTPNKLYVHNNKALIYSSMAGANGYSTRECTYGYDCEFTGDGRMLKITVLDIADKAAPKLEREMLFGGSYLNSRRIESTVHTAVIFPEFAIPGVSIWPADLPPCAPSEPMALTERRVTAIFEKLKADNTRLIEAADFSQYLPTIKDTRYVNGNPVVIDNVLAGCRGFYISQSPEGRSFLSLVSLTLDALDPLAATTILGKPGAIYASKESLYVASRQYREFFGDWYYDDSQGISEASTIHKFKLAAGAARTDYAGSGVAKGRVLNQFSMDERDGYLRMATTTGRLPSNDTHSTLLTLKEDGGHLVVAGTVDDIAPSEDIRSVRFNGSKAFIVTFKKTDPLFAFDLSDPENPVLAGELKIPGFSTYMHLMDETHLLTIGYDAQDEGNMAWFQGILLQIFDVSQMSAPALTHKEVIGTRGSTSEAATNHLAFNYFAPKNLLALPMVICEESAGGWNYGGLMTFSGLMVYQVTTAEGFDYLGGISHEKPETPESSSGYCANWWTRSNSIVKRSIIMDDYVYSVALNAIRVAHVEDLGLPVAEIQLLE
jgi:hypothetical protein